ncbi:hypothetical protein ACFQT0_13160 [Hymenobacter humi]|uniref:Uncharacterized protein n=1 Tax=Hymenobacter humi TaxID=1411620 RepID=A0ABW2U712_9BACT
MHLRHNPFHQEQVAWLELAAAAILALESYHIWHRHHVAEPGRGPAPPARVAVALRRRGVHVRGAVLAHAAAR